MYEGPTVAFKPQGPEGHDLALLVRTTPLYHDYDYTLYSIVSCFCLM